jgi:hypothetical protein
MKHSCIYLVAAAATLTACDSDIHSGEHGLAVSLSYDNANDAATEVPDIAVSIYNSQDSKTLQRSFASPQALASDIFDVSEGSYKIGVLANTDSQYQATGEPMHLTLNSSAANAPSAYYGVSTAAVPSVGLAYTNVALRRATSALTVKVTELPSAATLSVEVANAAAGIYPFVYNDETATYGVADNTSITMVLPTASGNGSLTCSGTLTPTVASSTNSVLHITVTLADGTGHTTNAVAPKMYPAGNYIFEVKYSELSSDLILSAIRINNWTDGWVINGEIPDYNN